MREVAWMKLGRREGERKKRERERILDPDNSMAGICERGIWIEQTKRVRERKTERERR